jgi:Rrf2 family transcriptional regulator, cysteine metabolism repressor
VRISAKAEYACVAMVELAARFSAGQPVSIKAIADGHGLSSRFLIHVMLQLKGAGLVASIRGPGGGYQLARSPDSIHLAEIVNTIERSPEASSVLSYLPSSPVSESLRQVWKEVSEAEQHILQKTTLADVARGVQEKGVASYQI